MGMVIYTLKQIRVMFLYLHKKIKKVMGFKAKHVVTENNLPNYIQENNNINVNVNNNNNISKQDVELLSRYENKYALD